MIQLDSFSDSLVAVTMTRWLLLPLVFRLVSAAGILLGVALLYRFLGELK